MATYKVLQDIEAEDKLIWNLSLRQFIYAVVAIAFLYVSYLFYIKQAWFLVPFSMPITLFFGFLAYPFGRDQPTEVWALAKLRFFIKPRKRLWNQDGLQELVTITAPKKVEHNFTDGLSQNEVRSRLEALAETLDSRGWAVKNVNNMVNPSLYQQGADRLIDLAAIPEERSEQEVHDFEDIMDDSNPNNQNFQSLIQQNASKQREDLIKKAGSTQVPNTGASKDVSLVDQPLVHPKPDSSSIDKNRGELVNMRSLRPLVNTFEDRPTAEPIPRILNNNDIMNLSEDNNRSIDSISRETANNGSLSTSSGEDEVVVSLH